MSTTTHNISYIFNQHLATLLTWKNILLKKYKENINADPHISYIQSQIILLIVTDGRKSKQVSYGSWIIANEKGMEKMSGFNPGFGMIEHIHSHGVELFGVLTVFLFLQECCMYYLTSLKSSTTFYCENVEVVHKLYYK